MFLVKLVLIQPLNVVCTHVLSLETNRKMVKIVTLIDLPIVLIYICCTLLFSLQYLSESSFGNDNTFFITQPLSCFVFHLPNLLLTQDFVYPNIFSSVPPPINNDDYLSQNQQITIKINGKFPIRIR